MIHSQITTCRWWSWSEEEDAHDSYNQATLSFTCAGNVNSLQDISVVTLETHTDMTIWGSTDTVIGTRSANSGSIGSLG